ncbi:ribokinase [Angustibacter sp. Root456]|uniref:ribokinase n=1 Tax=Angustibacter sp. Root456 TaxID=1736539 RepID=UPI000AEE0DB4|nr:ribokinase [Angustibacter sp. Root456]
MLDAAPPQIVVVGSANVDMVVQVRDLPRPGETVLARSYHDFPGGKGANQAMAAARLGRAVSFVGRTGADDGADLVRGALAAEGVDVSELRSIEGEATGRAIVLVDADAENSIVVVAGANAALVAEHVHAAENAITQARVVVAQLEVPVDVVRAAAELTRGLFVLNPAPARRLDDELMALVDVLVVNEGEFEVLAGQSVTPDPAALPSIVRAAALPAAVVVTLGGEGALVCLGDEVTAVPAPAVDVVDTTGAGDTFVGALADALARDEPLVDAVQWAVCAASLSTGALGATTGMPRRHQVESLLAAQPTQASSQASTQASNQAPSPAPIPREAPMS